MIVDPRHCNPDQYCRLLDLFASLREDIFKGAKTAEKALLVAIEQSFEIATDTHKQVNHA